MTGGRRGGALKADRLLLVAFVIVVGALAIAANVGLIRWVSGGC